MYVVRILYPVEVLGPGKRIGIWFCGCNHKCEGCSNPELWDFHEKYKVSVERVIKLVKQISENHKVDGFTITGGDPFEQPPELSYLIDYLLKVSGDILVYSGYSLQELMEKKDSDIDNTLRKIAVLVDGKYIEDRNNGAVLRGSDNQKVHILNPEYRMKYVDYLNVATNKIQNFTSGDGVISVGIHGPKFINDFRNLVHEKGLEEIK
jgi:anaerobic ribonucleoside-triphosphate reductase activating protein